MGRQIRWLVTCCCAISVLALPSALSATPPGTNGKIAFVRDGDIWAINADGSGRQQITTNPAPDHSPAWSPDGRSVAFVRSRVALIPTQGGPPREEQVTDLMVIDLTTNQVRTVVSGQQGPVFSPSWSPDGQRLVMTRTTPIADFSGTVWVVRRDGTGLRQLTPDYGLIDSVAWSPNSDVIALSTFGENSDLGLMNLGSGPVPPIQGLSPNVDPGDTDAGPSWAPDGAHLAFTRYRVAENRNCEATSSCWEGDIAVIDVPGGNQRIFKADGSDGGAAWSPDGARIAFTSDRSGRPQIWAIGADGGSPIQVTTHPSGGSQPDWQALPPPSPAPVLTGISPASRAAGAGNFTLTVNGSSFVAGSVVRWNGANRPTTRVSATQLRASIPASDLAAPGFAQVAVFTPGPGGGTSASAAFQVTSTTSSVTPPTSVAAPFIQGTALEGGTLTCQVGIWNGSPTGFAWQWLRDGVAITGAGAPTYVPGALDATRPVTCRITASNAGGASAAVSAPVVIGGASETATTPPAPAPPSPTGATTTTPRTPRPALLRLTVTRRAATVSLGKPVVLRLRFSRAVTRLPVQVQRKVGRRWVKVAARRVSGRSPVVSVRLRAVGLHSLRVKFARGAGQSFTTPVKVRVVR